MSVANRLLGYDIINQGIGGYVYDKKSLMPMEWYKPEVITYHDDWGMQLGPFFPPDLWREIMKPHTKAIFDHIHSYGRRALLHSCGHNADRIQCYIDGGFDLWQPQAMNDIGYLYDNYGDKIILAGYYYNGKNKPCYYGATYEFLGDDHSCEGTIGLRAASEVEFEDDGHAIAWAMQQ